MFLGPKLRTIVLNTDGSAIIRSSLLPALITFHPKLTRVEFDVMTLDSPMTTDAIHSALCGWNFLEKLRVDSLNLPSMLHLARLPNLGTLTVGRLPSDAAMINEFRARVESVGPAFSPLREFSTSSPTVPDFTSFMRAIDPDVLDCLHLTLDAPTPSEMWELLITTLAEKSVKTLTELNLKERYLHEHEVADLIERMVTADSLKPLLSFTNMVWLKFEAAHGIDLDDSMLRQMALAWPQLQSLHLSPRLQSAAYIPQITLSGLIPLAQHCPRLASLAIMLNAIVTTDPYSTEKPGGGIRNTALVELDVGESPL
ncbi:hypothetical protein B0H10DRAFT_2390028 [Mycena sp. CBHHK59/15]|nr:hypothetical protein B0H10DRAFT_2390028 [Mycena sp. CBHHK59/15]